MAMTRPSKTPRYAIAAVVAVLFMSNAAALDKNGNFESKQEQDAFIAVIPSLKVAPFSRWTRFQRAPSLRHFAAPATPHVKGSASCNL